MIKDIKAFMEIDEQREELEAIAKTYKAIGDVAHEHAAECYVKGEYVAYSVWLDLIDLCIESVTKTNEDLEDIKEQLAEIVNEET